MQPTTEVNGARDNWGSAARIGMFIVGGEVVPEAEWWAMAPEGGSVHAARVSARAPWAQWEPGGRSVRLAADLERGAAQFAALRPSAVVVGHTSSSLLGGVGWDEAVVAQLRDRFGPATHVTTNGLDCADALRSLGVQRPFLVLPPWFGDGMLPEATAYVERAGFAPSGVLRHVPDAKWSGLPPESLYAHFMHVEQRTDLLFDQVRAACPATADGILIAGTGFRCVGIVARLEATLGRPVVTANQASLWQCLRLVGVGTPVKGYGRLLEG